MDAQVQKELQKHRQALSAICAELGVRRLDLFGSAVQGVQARDLDFLVDLGDRAPAIYAEAFFQLKERLEALFKRPVDLVTTAALGNPYFRASVNAGKALVYAA
jgi:predicted nucleotidyltransferase